MTEDALKEMEQTAMPYGRGTSGIRNPVMGVSVLVLGFFFAGTPFPFSSFPLGVALVAALPRFSPIALCGVLLRCVIAYINGKSLLPGGLAAALICAMRFFFAVVIYGRGALREQRTVKGLHDSVSLRVLICSVVMLAISLVFTIAGGISAAKCASLVVGTISAAAFSFLLAFFFDESVRDTPAGTAGLGAFAFCVALSLSGMELFGFSIGLVVSFGLTLFIGYREDASKSAVTGLLCGLACGGIYAPVFALAGLVAGVFFEVNCLLAGISSLAVMICGGLYFGGMSAMTSFLPEVIAAAVLVTGAAALHLFPMPGSVREKERADCHALLLRKREEARERRLDTMSKSMNALSAILYGLSEKFRMPAPETLTERCIKIWKNHCRDCPNECGCHEIEQVETDSFSGRLASRLMAAGRLDRDKLYEITKTKCPKLGSIAAAINESTAKLMAEAIRDDKAKIFAADYEMAAQMFSDAISASDGGFAVDKTLSERLRKAFLRAGLRTDNLIVCGDRKKYVIATGDEITETHLRPSELQELCARVCGVPFCAPSFLIECGRGALTLEGECPYYVEYAGKQTSKRGERVCGDSVSVVKNDDDYFYCFICDGMGSGEEAALTSRISRVFLEKMLSCGNSKTTTLEMLNQFLCEKKGESFATVDLLEVDLMLGVASFIKSGAVPSYVIRNRGLYKIASGTFPVGILSQISAEVTEFELQDGDVILLLSDGVASDIEAGGAEDPAWFLEFIGSAWTDNLGLMASRILEAAESVATRSDDRTVELIRIRRRDGASGVREAS